MDSKQDILKKLCSKLKGRSLKAEVVRSGLSGVDTLVVSRGELDGFLCFFPKDVPDGFKIVFTLDIDRQTSGRRGHLCRYLENLSDRLPKYIDLPRAEISDKRYAEETGASEWFQTKLSHSRWDTLYIICRRSGDEWVLPWLEDRISWFMKLVDNLLYYYELPPKLPSGYSEAIAPFTHVYQFKIVLKDTDPAIWRRIQVPSTYTFWDLHKAIQDAMGWEDNHFNEFRVWHPTQEGNRLIFGIPLHDFEEGTLPEWGHLISGYITGVNSVVEYIYDFGDNWKHDVILEAVMQRKEKQLYPLCQAGSRACPPEDCGGPSSFAELLDNDEWDCYPDYNPEVFSPKQVVFSNPRWKLKSLFADNPELRHLLGIK